MQYQRIYRMIVSISVIGLLASCAVGPDFQRPSAPAVTAYTATPSPALASLATTTFGESQRIVEGAKVNQQWWQELGSARLNTLIAEALQASPTLAAAQARLRQAQEAYSAQAGSTLYPQVDANLGGQRQRFSPSSSGLPGDAREFSLYNASLGVRYSFDLSGGNRRTLETLAARSDYQRYQLEGARLTLVGNLVSSAVTQASFAGQVQVTEVILNAQEEQLALTRERVRLGQAAPDEELALKTQVEQTRAAVPQLRNQLQQSQHLLAVLAGRAPGSTGLPAFALQEFTLPTTLPLIVPSELVRTRPDIQAAEALLQAANAEYGVAVAKLYPQLNLSAALGSQALTAGALFGSSSTIWSLVGQLTQPLFNSGLSAEKRAAAAAFDAAAANYQGVVLEALRSVADVLRALENGTQRLSAFTAADTAAKASLASVQRQYRLGAASYLQLLVAQQQAQGTRINLLSAQAQRLVDSATLFLAMGGGKSSGDAALSTAN